MYINEINKSSWNSQAARYQQNADFSFKVVDYGDVRCPTDEDLNLIEDVCGKNVLELGCGGANCGIALAKKGAWMTCTDISSEQLRFAKKNAERENVSIRFFESPIENMTFLKDKEFDKVISMCAFQYVKDIGRVFNEVNRVLKPGGSFIFSLDNPIFSSIAARFLWKEDNLHDSYFYSGEEKWKWDNNDDFEFVTYRRPIFEYINLLVDAGFYIERFYELQINHEKPTSLEEELETKFPRSMVFKARRG